MTFILRLLFLLLSLALAGLSWLPTQPVSQPYQNAIERARAAANTFDYDSAIAIMDETITAAEADPVDDRVLAELYTARAEMVFLLYEWDRVLDDLNSALTLDATYAPAYFQRGVLYYTMADREAARDDFRRYLRFAPFGSDAALARDYIESITAELEALGNEQPTTDQ